MYFLSWKIKRYYIVTSKILEPVFFLEITQTRVQQIVLFLKNFYKGVELGYSSYFKIFLVDQYILQYIGKSLKTPWRYKAGKSGHCISLDNK